MASEDQQQEGFKQQLDRVAVESRTKNQPQQTNPVVEKITEYIPAAAKVLGSTSQPEESKKTEIPGPPERPTHDDKIEEFVRDQHRSKGEDGILSTQG